MRFLRFFYLWGLVGIPFNPRKVELLAGSLGFLGLLVGLVGLFIQPTKS